VTELRQRLTYANVTASLALFLALTGAGYAAGRIQGSQLAKRSVAGVKLKRDTITGREVRESRLGMVRSARFAGTAEKAITAEISKRLAGFYPESFRVACPTGFLYDAGVCAEPATRSAQPYGAAVGTCNGAGRRLPTHNELQALLARGAVAVASGGELTSSVAESRSVPGQLDVVVVTDDSGGAAFVPAGGTSAPRAFRCIEPRSN
jgi:hypothetical protein